MEKIQELNSIRKSNSSALYGLTSYSDLTPNEFVNQRLQLSLNEKISSRRHPDKNKNKRSVTNLPGKIDWRNKGVVTAIQDQKNCGACWAFSVIETMESMYAIKTGKLQPLSIQQIIDCAANDNKGCEGGDMCSLLQWLQDDKILVQTENSYPLHLRDETCKMKPGNDSGVQVTKFSCYSYVDQEDTILELLATHGPVAVAINAQSWQNYLDGVIHFHCNGTMGLLNHAVQIVGYDLTAEIPYYIVRNSWGKKFGDDGYLYVGIGQNFCGLANEVISIDVL